MDINSIVEFYQKSKPYSERMALKHNDRWNKVFTDYAAKISKFCTHDNLVLDLGCGGGWSSLAINRITSATVIGADCNKDSMLFGAGRSSNISIINSLELNSLIKACKIPNGELFFTVIDATNLPFGNETFDIVTSYAMLEHIFNVEKALKEMMRVVKQNGYLIIFAPNMLSPFRWLKLFSNGIICGRFHPDGKVESGLKIIVLNFEKIFSKKYKFTYRRPVLDYTRFLGSDYDAVFMANPLDLQKFFSNYNFQLLNLVDATSRLGKIVKATFPIFAGGIFLVAKKL